MLVVYLYLQISFQEIFSTISIQLVTMEKILE
jgi:hypothetical protein